MIATTVVEEVRRMLREGRFSQRTIAKRIGVSRGTVNAIAQGRHTARPQRHRNTVDGFIPPSGRPVRCPECGGLAQMPCLLCYIRSQGKRRRPTEHRLARQPTCETIATMRRD